jgi:predicted ATPase/DNA-binding CsgD family transcriptional regulator
VTAGADVNIRGSTELALLRVESAVMGPLVRVGSRGMRSTHDGPSAPRATGLSSFVGRERELAALAETLARARLVTLTGTGGVGKTRLATEYAHATRRSGDIVLVELAPLDQEGDVAARVALAAGVQLPAGSDVGRLAAAFDQRGTLVILDNCEHVVDSCARVAAALLGASRRMRILATSREPLRVDGEVVLPVEPLSVTAATRLFLERARAHGAALPDGGAVVSELCQRLDRVPLALELAAARARALSPHELLELLGQRLSLLTAGYRLAAPRHRTLEATVEWGYELLTAGEQLAFSRLGVFSSWFTRDAAQDIADTDVATLSALVDKSMLQARLSADGLTSYRLLETLRAYALKQLRLRGEDAALRVQLREHFMRRVDDAWAQRPVVMPETVLSELGDALDDLRVVLSETSADAPRMALHLLGRTREVWFTLAPREALEMIERLLQRPNNRDLDRALALLAAGQWAFTQQEPELASRYLGEARSIAQELSEHEVTAWCDFFSGVACFLAMRLDAAKTLLRQAGERARASSDELLGGRCLANMGVVAFLRGDQREAHEHFERASALLESTSDRWGMGHCQTYWGMSCKAAQRGDDAERHFLKAMDLLAPLRDVALLGIALAGYAAMIVKRQPALGARIAAAAESRGSVAGRYVAWTLADIEACRAESSHALGDSRARRIWAEGAALPLADAAALAMHRTQAPPDAGPLSRREADVARLVAQGMSNAAIAGRLYLSERTVESHVANALVKTGCRNRTDLASWVTAHLR